MNKNEFKKTDLIAIAGILMFAIVYAVDKLVYEMPKTTFIVLVAIAMVLLIVGAIVSRKTTADIHRRTAPDQATAGAVFLPGRFIFAEFGKGGKFGRSPTDPPQGTGRNKNGDKMCMGA